MKKILLFAIAALFGFAAYAQSFQMHYEGEVLPDQGTITVTGEASAAEIVTEVAVTNISGVPMDVKVKKYDVDLLPNTSTVFCWGACFPSYVYVSPNSILIQPDATCEEFSAHYQPGGVSGVSFAMYTFFDANNVNDSVSFNVEFNAGTVGIGEPNHDDRFVSAPYPNPASDQTSIDFNFPEGGTGKIVLMNMLGAVVKETAITRVSGTARLDVSDLRDGVYFYSVVHNNQVIETKKLVVSR